MSRVAAPATGPGGVYVKFVGNAVAPFRPLQRPLPRASRRRVEGFRPGLLALVTGPPRVSLFFPVGVPLPGARRQENKREQGCCAWLTRPKGPGLNPDSRRAGIGAKPRKTGLKTQRSDRGSYYSTRVPTNVTCTPDPGPVKMRGTACRQWPGLLEPANRGGHPESESAQGSFIKR